MHSVFLLLPQYCLRSVVPDGKVERQEKRVLGAHGVEKWELQGRVPPALVSLVFGGPCTPPHPPPRLRDLPEDDGGSPGSSSGFWKAFGWCVGF